MNTARFVCMFEIVNKNHAIMSKEAIFEFLEKLK